MAQTPAAPREDGTSSRVRRNLGQPQFRRVTRGKVKPPPMPGEANIRGVRRQIAVEYWNELWTDLGEMYTKADRFPIARLCVLHSLAMVGKLGAQAQGELRQLEASFGGSPAARRKLWIVVVEDVTDAEDGGDDAPIDMESHRARRARITGVR